MQPLTQRLGFGAFFTVLGILSAVLGIGSIWGIRGWGMGWRNERGERREEREGERVLV